MNAKILNSASLFFDDWDRLHLDDPEGIEQLRFAAEKDPEWVEAVRRTLAQYHA